MYDNSGILFKNNRKEKENHPDYTGKATIEGKEYSIGAWLKDGKNGKFFSFSFSPMEQREQEQAKAEFDSDIPF